MRRGEVWWVNFDPSVGGEIKKLRPAVIVSNNAASNYLNRLQVVPLTSNIERVYPGEALVTINNRRGKALATQLTTVSKQRLGDKMGELSPRDMSKIDQAIRVQLGLVEPAV